jgi:hypothetical protein
LISASASGQLFVEKQLQGGPDGRRRFFQQVFSRDQPLFIGPRRAYEQFHGAWPTRHAVRVGPTSDRAVKVFVEQRDSVLEEAGGAGQFLEP